MNYYISLIRRSLELLLPNLYRSLEKLVVVRLLHKISRVCLHFCSSLYKMKSILKRQEHLANSAERNGISQKERWYRMLGHVNFRYLNILGKEQLLTGIPNEFEKEFLRCKMCIKSKMHNLLFKNNRTKAREIMEIIHTDMCGPFKTTGVNGEKYFISFIDDYSKVTRIYCIKSKDEVFDSLVQFVNENENLTGKRLKILRCDNGEEYLYNQIYKFARDYNK